MKWFDPVFRLLRWRWAPAFGLVLGALSFALLAALVIPESFGVPGGATTKFARSTVGREGRPTTPSSPSFSEFDRPTADVEQNENPVAPPVTPSVPPNSPVESFFRNPALDLPPPLPDTEPPPEPPAASPPTIVTPPPAPPSDPPPDH